MKRQEKSDTNIFKTRILVRNECEEMRKGEYSNILERKSFKYSNILERNVWIEEENFNWITRCSSVLLQKSFFFSLSCLSFFLPPSLSSLHFLAICIPIQQSFLSYKESTFWMEGQFVPFLFLSLSLFISLVFHISRMMHPQKFSSFSHPNLIHIITISM